MNRCEEIRQPGFALDAGNQATNSQRSLTKDRVDPEKAPITATVLSHLGRAVLGLALWWLAVFAAWFSVLALNTGLRDPLGLFVMAALFSARFVVLPVALFHLSWELLQKTRWKRWTLAAVSLLAALAALPWALQLAFELTAGDWISRQPWVSWFAGAFIVAVEIVIVAAALWHRQLVWEGPRGRSLWPRVVFGRRSKWALTALGGIAFIAACHVTASYMRAYCNLAEQLLAPLAFVGGTVLAAMALVRLPDRASRMVAGVAVVVFLAALSLALFSKGRPSAPSSRAQLATLTYLSLRSGTDDFFQFGVDRFTSAECVPRRGHAVATGGSVSPAKVKNVLFVSVDALRPDVIGKEVAGKSVTPHLSRIKEQSLFFENAHATYPATLFAVGSALTGRTASDILFSKELPENVFEKTRKSFDETRVFLPKNKWFEMPVLEKLFTKGAQASYSRSAGEQTDAFLGSLESAKDSGRSIFAWIHYYEPHPPYLSKRGFEFGKSRAQKYYSEVAFIDAEIGRLDDYLKEHDWYDDTLVIFFSDHGQALGENQYYGHHVYLNSWVIDIVLMVRAPQLSAGVSETTVSGIDIAPTVLRSLGQTVPKEVEGRSLFDKMDEPPGESWAIAEAFPLRGEALFHFSEKAEYKGIEGLQKKLETVQSAVKSYSPKVALIKGDLRLIIDRMTGAEQLYDDGLDPANEDNLMSSSQARLDLSWMRRALMNWHEDKSLQYYCDVSEK